MTVPYIVSNRKITLFLDNEPHLVETDHPFYARVVHCLKNDLEDELRDLLSSSVPLDELGAELVNGQVFWNGKALHNVLVDRIVEQTRMGLGAEHMLRFLENLMLNPSESSRKELYDFLANRSLPITEDGCFLAYKAVRDDFYDIYSGTVLNTVGSVISMERGEVDPNRDRQCSFGYHVGAIDYVRGYGNTYSKYLLVKVNPKDAVAVPLDHGAQKLRVCSYEVLAVLDRDTQLDYPVYSSDGGSQVESLHSFQEAEWEDDWDEEEEEEYLDSLWDADDSSLAEIQEYKDTRKQWYLDNYDRDQVVDEAVRRGLVAGVNAGRALRKEGCAALLADEDSGR